jgi:hypothetical protein
MEHRIVWVHGIGHHTAGYSDSWRQSFDHYLHLTPASYLEVVWDTVFHPEQAGTRDAARAAGAMALTPREELAAREVEDEVLTILGARRSALEATEPGPGTRAVPTEPVEWSDRYVVPGRAPARGLATWLVNPDEYLGDFAKYLVSKSVRAAVKEQFKQVLRSLASGSARVSVISHSWGTVVAYDSLLDLSAELPGLRVADLFTLGSPLWLVRRLLEERSGRKPADVDNFVNVHARGDFVGSWLRPAFQVDKDYEVPTIGPDAHGSYFVEGNVPVQENIVASDVLRA